MNPPEYSGQGWWGIDFNPEKLCEIYYEVWPKFATETFFNFISTQFDHFDTRCTSQF